MGDFSSILATVEGNLSTGIDIASDPYLSETLCHFGQLHQISVGQSPGQCAVTPDGIPGGVGLGKIQPFLRGYVYSQAHPWVIPIAGALLFGIPFMIGYSMRRR